VVADGPATSRQLKMTSLDQVFALHTTLDAALADLRGGN
jgi:anti-sigma B factor antagonist